MESKWTIEASSRVIKQVRALPPAIQKLFDLLTSELQTEGPIQPEWHHFGKLQGKDHIYHCHLNKGKPRYVAVWEVRDTRVLLMSIRYAGTHENADYKHL